MDGWDDGSLPLAAVAALLRQSLACDPPCLIAGSLLALRAVLRYQPKLRQGPEELEPRLADRAKEMKSFAKEIVQELHKSTMVARGSTKIACFLVGNVHFFLIAQYEDAVAWYHKAADNGLAVAQCELGYCYDQGCGVVKDETASMKSYELAAEQEFPTAQYNMAVHYSYGCGVKVNLFKAVRLYALAAMRGWIPALNGLGLSYFKDTMVSENEGVQLVRFLVEQGFTGAAEYILGCCYIHGQEGLVKVDALYWFRLGAEQGCAYAQYNMGWCYKHNQGILKDDIQVTYWFRRAATQGFHKAQYMLGWQLEYGHGVQKNVGQALMWYEKAALQGYGDARTKLKTVGGRGQRWFPQLHPYTPFACQWAAWTTLLAAGRFLVVLPNELWVNYIFPNWTREDFTK